MLSPYCQQLTKELEYKPSKVGKLVPNLWPKGSYILHYRNLQMYLSLSMELTKIHRVLQFKQQAWLKPHINLNTQLRAQASNKVERDFFKLMNNSVFGKTMEDVKRRVNIKLVSEPSIFKKNVAKVPYKRSVVFVSDEQKKDYFVGMDMKPSTIILEKPIYIGFSVLGLSKLWMYNFHYSHILRKYGTEKVKLLFTDTDSSMYQIQTEDVYKDMHEDQDLFDTSKYPPEHFLFIEVNRKVIGKFKDENAGKPVLEFVGLRAKMYSMKTEDGKEKKTAQGVKRPVLAKEINHEDYKIRLFTKQECEHKMISLRSEKHKMFTLEQTKKSLSPFDDKRYILEDGYATRAHGHWRTDILKPSN